MDTFDSMNNPLPSTQKNATPVRLGELKAPLQEEAMRLDRSLNWLVKLACKELLQRIKKKKKKA
jgi:hypothetical protein